VTSAHTQTIALIELTNLKMGLSNSMVGSIGFPELSSMGLEMSSVASMDVINSQMEDSTRFAPGHLLHASSQKLAYVQRPTKMMDGRHQQDGEGTQTFGQNRTHSCGDHDVLPWASLPSPGSALARRHLGSRRFFRHAK
jgi:hypothetical protein